VLGVTVNSTVLGSIIIGIAVVVGVPVMVHDWRKAGTAPSRSGRSIARRTVLLEALVVGILVAAGVAVKLGGDAKPGANSGGDGGN
jgi:hypothetical protein